MAVQLSAWYPETVRAQAKELFTQGLTLTQISRRLDVPSSTVAKWLDPNRQKQRDRKAKQRRRARELRDRGLSYRRIAAHLGVAYSTVREWVDPAAAEKSLASKEANRRQMRAQEREAREADKGPERPPSPFDLLVSNGKLNGSSNGHNGNGHVAQHEEHVEQTRRKMPVDRRSLTHQVHVDGFGFFVTAGLYEDGTVGEIFIKGAGQEGSTVQGLFDAFATMWSIGVQYGAEFDMLARKFAHMRFAPLGQTDNPDIEYAFSIVDYVVRWLSLHFGSSELNADLARITEEMRRV
jgi:transposase